MTSKAIKSQINTYYISHTKIQFQFIDGTRLNEYKRIQTMASNTFRSNDKHYVLHNQCHSQNEEDPAPNVSFPTANCKWRGGTIKMRTFDGVLHLSDTPSSRWFHSPDILGRLRVNSPSQPFLKGIELDIVSTTTTFIRCHAFIASGCANFGPDQLGGKKATNFGNTDRRGSGK